MSDPKHYQPSSLAIRATEYLIWRCVVAPINRVNAEEAIDSALEELAADEALGAGEEKS